MITGDYVIDLMRLAQLHDLPMLVNLCLKFILVILDIKDLDTFKAVLNAACEYQLKDLIWEFIVFWNYEWDIVEVLLEDTDLFQEAKRILYLAKQCSRFSIDPHWSSILHHCGRKCILMKSSQEMETLRELHELCGIEVLTIYNMEDNQRLKYKTTEYLEDVSKFLPNLHTLCIMNSPVSQLPDIWLNNLKKIYVNGSDFYRSIDFPEAECIEFKNCNVIKINAPKAKNVSCVECGNLTEVTTPQAEKIYLSDCKNLVTEEFPEAIEIELSGWLFKNLTALKAESIVCRNSNVKTIRAPNAKKSFHTCSIEDFEASLVKVVRFEKCDITDLNLPVAPDSPIYESHERLNDELGKIACLLDECKLLTSVEKEELGQSLKDAITYRRPPMMLKTKEEFGLDDKFKLICGEIWYSLDLGEFKITFDEASAQHDEAIAHIMQEGDQ